MCACSGRQRSTNDHKPVIGAFDLIHFGFAGSRQEVTAGGGEPEPECVVDTGVVPRSRLVQIEGLDAELDDTNVNWQYPAVLGARTKDLRDGTDEQRDRRRRSDV